MTVDPCYGAGLVCGLLSFNPLQQLIGSCRSPIEGEPCLPGGPPCQAHARSTQTPTCVQRGNSYACAQPCDVNNDCPSPIETCDLQNSHACEVSGCDDPYGTCTLGNSGQAAGLCVPDSLVDAVLGHKGYCLLVAGTAQIGEQCDSDATKQGGRLCDAQSICVGGLCQPICDAAPVHADAGCLIGSCQSLNGPASDDAVGICVTPCDFTDPVGGGCFGGIDKPPEKCLPFPFVEAVNIGYCVATIDNPFDGGALCDPTTDVDPCRPGTTCLGPFGANAEFRCTQLCTASRGCPAPETCIGVGGRGYCQ
jgi:hypothetical protein